MFENWRRETRNTKKGSNQQGRRQVWWGQTLWPENNDELLCRNLLGFFLSHNSYRKFTPNILCITVLKVIHLKYAVYNCVRTTLMRMILIVLDNIHPKYTVENSVGSKGEVFRVTGGTPGEVATTCWTALRVAMSTRIRF